MYFRYRTEQERNEHCITHWASFPYSCGVCSKSAFSLEIAEKHFQQSHPNLQVNVVTTGPTVAKELNMADELHINEVREEVGPNVILPSVAPFSEKKEVNTTDILDPSPLLTTVDPKNNPVTSEQPKETRDPLKKTNEEVVDVCTVNNFPTNTEYEVNQTFLCSIFFYFFLKYGLILNKILNIFFYFVCTFFLFFLLSL